MSEYILVKGGTVKVNGIPVVIKHDTRILTEHPFEKDAELRKRVYPTNRNKETDEYMNGIKWILQQYLAILHFNKGICIEEVMQMMEADIKAVREQDGDDLLNTINQ